MGRDESRLVKEVCDLMRVRSADLTAWKSIWTAAGASSGILEDMSVEQLERVKRLTAALPTVKASRHGDRKGMEEWR